MCNKSEQHIHKASIESFRLRLWEIKWDNLNASNDSNLAYTEFLETLTSLYDNCFPRVEIKVKTQNSFKPWITKGIAQKKTKIIRKIFEKPQPSKLSHVQNI